MREQFEKLPSVEKYLKYVFWDNETQGYCNNSGNPVPLDFATFINGAWCAYQEQQKKIDKIIESVNGFKLAASSFDTEYNEGGYTACTLILNDIENILK